MKRKITKEDMKASLATALRAVLFNYLLTAVCFFLLWYWVTPKLFPLFPRFAEYLQKLDDDGLLVAYDIFYTISSVLAMFPGMCWAYRLSKRRKKDFFKHMDGRISYAAGVRYHLTEYGASDGISLAAIAFVFALISAAFSGGVGKLFPLVFYLSRALGVLPGWIVAVVLMLGAAICGIFFSQRKWRAEHFVGE